jgi:hypothetical protein
MKMSWAGFILVSVCMAFVAACAQAVSVPGAWRPAPEELDLLIAATGEAAAVADGSGLTSLEFDFVGDLPTEVSFEVSGGLRAVEQVVLEAAPELRVSDGLRCVARNIAAATDYSANTARAGLRSFIVRRCGAAVGSSLHVSSVTLHTERTRGRVIANLDSAARTLGTFGMSSALPAARAKARGTAKQGALDEDLAESLGAALATTFRSELGETGGLIAIEYRLRGTLLDLVYVHAAQPLDIEPRPIAVEAGDRLRVRGRIRTPSMSMRAEVRFANIPPRTCRLRESVEWPEFSLDCGAAPAAVLGSIMIYDGDRVVADIGYTTDPVAPDCTRGALPANADLLAPGESPETAVARWVNTSREQAGLPPLELNLAQGERNAILTHSRYSRVKLRGVERPDTLAEHGILMGEFVPQTLLESSYRVVDHSCETNGVGEAVLAVMTDVDKNGAMLDPETGVLAISRGAYPTDGRCYVLLAVYSTAATLDEAVLSDQLRVRINAARALHGRDALEDRGQVGADATRAAAAAVADRNRPTDAVRRTMINRVLGAVQTPVYTRVEYEDDLAEFSLWDSILGESVTGNMHVRAVLSEDGRWAWYVIAATWW